MISERFKNYLISGLIIIIPVVTTVTVVRFILNTLSRPFLSFFSSIFNIGTYLENNILFYAYEILIVSVVMLSAVCIGAVAKWLLIRKMVKIGENIVEKIPFVRAIYKASRDVVSTILKSRKSPFKKVVLVQFPHKDSYSIGFIVKKEKSSAWLKTDHEINLTSVFVPTTPNPTTGFILLVKEDNIIETNLTMEDGLKYVISCGTIEPSSIYNVTEDCKN